MLYANFLVQHSLGRHEQDYIIIFFYYETLSNIANSIRVFFNQVQEKLRSEE